MTQLGAPPGARSILGTTRRWTKKWTVMVSLLGLAILPCAFAQSYWIDRVAGNPDAADDGVPAREAHLGFPFALAVDGSGNLYIADSVDSRVRKVDAAGIITTVAGTGSYGFGGDGGRAANALLALPQGLAVDGSGNLYIADSGNQRVRKVDAAGIITTVAGTGDYGFGGDGGPAANALLNEPQGLAVDGSGNLYIADSGNERVRRVDPSGTITTIAGSLGSNRMGSGDCGPASAARLGPPADITLDGSGRIVIATPLSHTVRRLSVVSPASCRASIGALPEWTVSSGRVLFGGLSSRGCLTLNAPVSGVSYLVHTSQWQRRAPGASVWSTVGGTLRTGRLCAFEPTGPGQYRAVAEISVASRGRARYRSANAIAGPSVVADREPSFGSASISDQSYVSGTAIRPITLPTATGGDSPLAYSLQPSVPGLSFDTGARQLSGTPTSTGTYSMQFSVRDSDGDTATLRFTITVQPSGGVGGAQRYSVGDRITTLPAGRWTPDVTSGGSFLYSGGTATVRLNNDGYIEEGDYRYTCATSGGCEVVNGTVTQGVIVESTVGESPSTEDDHGDEPASATSVTLGSPVAGRIDPGSDEDYFRLRLSASTAVAIYTTGSLDTVGSLQDAAGGPVDSDDDGGEGFNFRMEGTLSAGTHYVEVGSYGSDTGSYTLHVERRETGTEPDPPSGGNYTPLDDWTVSNGRVRFLFFSAGRCVQLGNTTINGVTYTIHSSKWQKRANSASAWVDIPGTAATGAVCSYSPTDPGQYRGVAEISIGGNRGRYATKNVLTVP